MPEVNRVRYITERVRKLEDLLNHISATGIVCKNCGQYNNYNHVCTKSKEKKHPFTNCRDWCWGEKSLTNIYLRPQDTRPLNEQ
ncbi:MAG: hypothetical protein FWG28_05050 [Clostridiales bacterium]|nr:hypothetical protein [Clostridiales bacterium]